MAQQGIQKSKLGISTFSQTMADYDALRDGALLSRRTYNLIMGACLLWGFAINVIMCASLGSNKAFMTFATSHMWVILIAYLVLAFVGIFINAKSTNPAISFVGYNLIVLPLGLALTVIVAMYPVLSVMYAFVATAGVTVVMLVVSTAKPEFFFKISRSLFIALIAAIIIEVVLTLVTGAHLGIFDWIIALIFCGYIGYDWARSQSVPSTLDNAIDCACALYIDIVNLFIRILEIVGNEK